MDVDAAALRDLLAKHEALVHRQGWDRPARLFVIYETEQFETDRVYRRAMAGNPRLGPPTRHGPYSAQPMLAEEIFGSLPVADGLLRFAFNVAYVDTDEAVQTLRPFLLLPGVVGYGLCAESYSKEYLPDERYNPRRRLADTIGAHECRTVYAADVTGEVHAVERQRGQKPVLNKADRLAGPVVNALRLLADITAGTVPPLAEYHTRYPALDVPLLDDETPGA